MADSFLILALALKPLLHVGQIDLLFGFVSVHKLIELLLVTLDRVIAELDNFRLFVFLLFLFGRHTIKLLLDLLNLGEGEVVFGAILQFCDVVLHIEAGHV